ncbi:unnamed protein product [Protopolystoma xenopodis]|uniref:Uncharacterized protein n=1 Tax=Protopolystoma xenopodis TaxID=117903 RepID=A0A3S5A041_9PLAT|nr:unnamed protein product [Protopolystoma xenopodis]
MAVIELLTKPPFSASILPVSDSLVEAFEFPLVIMSATGICEEVRDCNQVRDHPLDLIRGSGVSSTNPVLIPLKLVANRGEPLPGRLLLSIGGLNMPPPLKPDNAFVGGAEWGRRLLLPSCCITERFLVTDLASLANLLNPYEEGVKVKHNCCIKVYAI